MRPRNPTTTAGSSFLFFPPEISVSSAFVSKVRDSRRPRRHLRRGASVLSHRERFVRWTQGQKTHGIFSWRFCLRSYDTAAELLADMLRKFGKFGETRSNLSGPPVWCRLCVRETDQGSSDVPSLLRETVVKGCENEAFLGNNTPKNSAHAPLEHPSEFSGDEGSQPDHLLSRLFTTTLPYI